MSELPFWQRKPLTSLTTAEWESLCDGCGRCCVHKLEDIDTGLVHYTNVACRLLDSDSCRCSDYANRLSKVPDCADIRAHWPDIIDVLPSTCAYRLLGYGGDLPTWHPLRSGNTLSVLDAGVSVRGRVIPEQPDTDLEDHLAPWLD